MDGRFFFTGGQNTPKASRLALGVFLFLFGIVGGNALAQQLNGP